MKERFKNFIAFTLSEMMIVLLIFSVISAAILPTITTRKENANPNITSGGSGSEIWDYETTTNGIVYNSYENTSSKPYPVMMNSSTFPFSAASLTGSSVEYVNAAVYLLSKSDDITTNSTTNEEEFFKLNNQGNSWIEFTETNGANQYYPDGRIAIDVAGSIYIGYGNTLYLSDDNAERLLDNQDTLLIGNYLGEKKVSAEHSVIIGNYSASNPSIPEDDLVNIKNSIFVGQNITPYMTNDSVVVMGYYAGYPATDDASKQSSQQSVVMGSLAGYNSSPSQSVVIGKEAAYYTANKGDARSQGSAKSSVFIGSNAGMSYQVKSYYDVKIGYYAGYASHSAGSPAYATPWDNVTIGYYANNDLTYNVSIGSYAGNNIGEGFGDKNKTVFIGAHAGEHAYNSDDTVFIGYYAGANQSGAWNSVFIGNYAGSEVSESGSNTTMSVAIGAGALSATTARVSDSDLYQTVCIGKNACKNIDKIAETVAIGYDITGTKSAENSLLIGSGCKSTSGVMMSNTICISGSLDASKKNITVSGKQAWPSKNDSSSSGPKTIVRTFIAPSMQDNSTSYLNSSIVLYAGTVLSYGPITSYSDKRLKENIVPLNSTLENVRKFNIYEYNLKKETKDKVKIGVIAQELQKIYPQAVTTFNNYLTISSDWIMYSAINAIKELDKIAQNVQSQLAKTKSDYSKLLVKVQNLEVRLNNLEKSNKILLIKLDDIEKIKKMEQK